MSEGREQRTQREDECDRLAVGLRLREVQHVLDDREARRDGRGVHEAVDRSVDVLAPHEEDHEDAEALRALLDERGDDDRGRAGRGELVHPGLEERELGEGVDHERDDDGDACAPREGEREGGARLRFPPVDPADREEQPREGDEREEGRDRDGSGPDRGGEEDDDAEREHAADDGAHDGPAHPGPAGRGHGISRCGCDGRCLARGPARGHRHVTLPGRGRALGHESSISIVRGIGAWPARRRPRTRSLRRTRWVWATASLWKRRASWTRYQAWARSARSASATGSAWSAATSSGSSSTVRRIAVSPLSTSSRSPAVPDQSSSPSASNAPSASRRPVAGSRRPELASSAATAARRTSWVSSVARVAATLRCRRSSRFARDHVSHTSSASTPATISATSAAVMTRPPSWTCGAGRSRGPPRRGGSLARAPSRRP